MSVLYFLPNIMGSQLRVISLEVKRSDLYFRRMLATI